MKLFTTLGLAAATLITLSPALSAQTRALGPHDETAAAMVCLLQHQHDECAGRFTGSARSQAQQWLFWSADKDFRFGPLVTSNYIGTEPDNAYLTRFLSGRAADVYDVKFGHQEMTFYIVPPKPDGKVQYMRIRSGAPNDERTDLFTGGPG